MIVSYDVSDRVRLGNHSGNTSTAAFTTVGGVATDPTEVVLTVREPDGTLAVYRWPTPGVGESALSKETTGRFYADVGLDAAGLWAYRVEGTGAVVASEEGMLHVRKSVVAAEA
jgi:hypothetical protein